MVQKRAIGNSGLAVAPLALGGNVFDWTADEAASFAMLDAFVDAGGTMIDTADVYSAWVPGHVGGESERMIGRWLKRSGKRDQVVIATKVGFMAGLEAGHDRAGVRRLARAARRRHASTSITSTRTTRRCRWPTALARSMRWCRRARSAPSACPTSPPSASTRRWRPRAPTG